MMKSLVSMSAVMLVAALWSTAARADDPAGFFDTESGLVPIIILAPHGGTLGNHPTDIENQRSVNANNVLLNDYRTDDIAHRLANALEGMGLKPYLVVNQIDRHYLDLNRDPADNGGTAAYEDPQAAAYYNYYHGAADDYVNEVFATYGRGILLDIHGQAAQNSTIFRGTRNGDTVTYMLNNFGEAALTGPNSIFGQLDTLGYGVNPANNLLINTDPETTYIGGYTVETYGSQNAGGIDAIQIELGRDFRDLQLNEDIWKDTADDLAIAVQAYYNTYLAVPEPTSLALLGYGGLLVARRRRN